MASSCTRLAVNVFAFRLPNYLFLTTLFLVGGWSSLFGTNIEPYTTAAGETERFVVNGSFVGRGHTYTARSTTGGSLPSWVRLDAASGTFTFTPPSSANGQTFDIEVTATKAGQATQRETFTLLVDQSTPGCEVDANTDGLQKILDRDSRAVRLQASTTDDNYRWTGPEGYSSSFKDPMVTTPGVYVLRSPDSGCDRASVVEVLPGSRESDRRENRVPVARLAASAMKGYGPMTVTFDGSGSSDGDGSVISYQYHWAGGGASGASPVVVFPVGIHKVILTVTDNFGARSSDFATLEVLPPVAELPTGTYVLEAECAVVGKRWRQEEDPDASGGEYLYSTFTSRERVPGTGADFLVRFSFDAVAGSYNFFSRVRAERQQNDSYWMRINGGSWINWNGGFPTGAGFQWGKAPAKLPLRNGRNEIDIAYREADTHFDKLYLTSGNDVPSGKGPKAINCDYGIDNLAPLARARASVYVGNAPLAVTLDGSASSDADDGIVDYAWKWKDGTASGKEVKRNFAAGNYSVTLTVTDASGETDYDVIALQVRNVGSKPAGDLPTAGPSGGDDFYLEAECATVGGKQWKIDASSAASGGQYVEAVGNSPNGVPADIADNRVRFTFDAAGGDYRLFVRIEAKTNLDDSYWVRVNGGNWIAWRSGIDFGQGFQWNEFPLEPLALREGSNTIDFSFREDGTRLDKLYFTRGDAAPSGSGGSAINCNAGFVGGDEIWMEAECAQLGDGWKSRRAPRASGGSYVSFSGPGGAQQPTATQSSQQLRFNFELSQRGLYTLFLRMGMPDTDRNSLWVKIDDGPWVKFWRGINGQRMQINYYGWREVNDDGEEIRFSLAAGRHTVTIANRESGTRVDKLYLTATGGLPVGLGEAATNCSTTTTVGMMARTPGSGIATDTEAATTGEPELRVFPNPAIDHVQLELTSDYAGPVEISVTDVTGRRVLQQRVDKTADVHVQRLDVSRLPAGMYHVRLIGGDRQSVQPFVKR